MKTTKHNTITFHGCEDAYKTVANYLNLFHGTDDFTPNNVGDAVWYDRKMTLGDITEFSAISRMTYFAVLNPDKWDMEDHAPIYSMYVAPIMEMGILNGYNCDCVISWIMETTWADTELYIDFDFKDQNDYETTLRMLQLMVCHDFIGWAKEKGIEDESRYDKAA